MWEAVLKWVIQHLWPIIQGLLIQYAGKLIKWIFESVGELFSDFYKKWNNKTQDKYEEERKKEWEARDRAYNATDEEEKQKAEAEAERHRIRQEILEELRKETNSQFVDLNNQIVELSKQVKKSSEKEIKESSFESVVSVDKDSNAHLKQDSALLAAPDSKALDDGSVKL